VRALSTTSRTTKNKVNLKKKEKKLVNDPAGLLLKKNSRK
jgi:hypothetical protein